MTSRRGLAGLLTAYGVSITGTRLSAVALPWFVLVTTGSATATGLVGLCEMAPYVVVKALGGPVIDRVGGRRISIAADVVSAVLVGAVPLLHAFGALPFPALLVLVACAGAARGPGDGAKSALVPAMARAAGARLERATGLTGTLERLATTLGPALAGVVIAAFGPLTALVADAASFAVAAAAIAVAVPARVGTVPDPSPAGAGGERYLDRLREGFAFLRGEPLLRAIAGMVAVTNLVDAGVSGVLIPVWAHDHGGGPAAIGVIVAAFGVAGVAASATATAVAHRLPRRVTYFAGFIVAGAPRIAVLAFGMPLWAVAAVWATAGLGSGLINPIINAILFERIPPGLVGRVSTLVSTTAWAGIPFGGPLAGVAVAVAGLAPAVLAFAAVYLAATTATGMLPQWREMDASRAAPELATAAATAAATATAE